MSKKYQGNFREKKNMKEISYLVSRKSQHLNESQQRPNGCLPEKKQANQGMCFRVLLYQIPNTGGRGKDKARH